jgi:hypothetical protein
MESIVSKLESIQKQENIAIENNSVAKAMQKMIEELSKLGLDKKPEYTIPQADTIGKGYYSMLSKNK